VSYFTSQDIPLQFKPSTVQGLMQSAERMTLSDEMVWSDPWLGLKVDLSALQFYSPQTTTSGLIRWYGVYDGTTIQLTAEPANPLKPEFSSKEYAEALSAQIMSTLPDGGEQLGGQAVTHPELGAAHTLSFAATFNGSTQHIHLWHMSHNDVVLTLSVNAPEAKADDARALAAQVFTGITKQGL
jgi:hypothetical protein